VLCITSKSKQTIENEKALEMKRKYCTSVTLNGMSAEYAATNFYAMKTHLLARGVLREQLYG
jgi:hypothetical protein